MERKGRLDRLGRRSPKTPNILWGVEAKRQENSAVELHFAANRRKNTTRSESDTANANPLMAGCLFRVDFWLR